MEEDLPLLIADEQLESSLANSIGAIRGYLLSGDNFYKDLFYDYTEQGKQYEEVIDNLGYIHEYEDLFVQADEWREFIEQEVFAIYDQGDQEMALDHLLNANDQFSAMITAYQEKAQARENTIMEQEKSTLASGESTIIVGLVVTVGVIGAGILIALFTANTILKPLILVKTRLEEIADGDLSKDYLVQQSKDEIGQLMVTTNEMHGNMKELLHKIMVVSKTVGTHSEELTQSAYEVSLGSDQVARTMEDLASGTESQAHNASELSSMMSTFAAKVKETNENGEHIEETSNNVLAMTSDGSKLMATSSKQMAAIDRIVHEAFKKVEGLDQHTQQISELISVIQDIADQTNLLALNAAIEAARAGEHGQGFAVVADEVRKLAEQVSDSVTNITEIVFNIQNESKIVTESLQSGYSEVEQGTNQIIKTETTFSRISDAVTEMVTNIQHIAGNLTHIAENSQEMNHSIQDIAAISEESAAGVEETSAQAEETTSAMEEISESSKQLRDLAEELNGLVLQFKL